MANFRVKVGTGAGEIAERDAMGVSAKEVRNKFLDDGYFVFDVARVWSLSDFVQWGRRVSSRQFILFNREFRGLVKAGVPVVEGLQMVLDRMRPGPLRTMITEVHQRLVQGDPLSQSFRGFQNLVPPYYPALLFAGEQSGRLAEVLERFIDQESRLQRMRSKFRNALTYPGFLLIVGFFALYVILGRAMPQFAGLYRDSAQELPWSTEMVMSMGEFVSQNSAQLGLSILIALVLFIMTVRSSWGRSQLERLVWHIPLFGSLWQLQNQNAFAWTMNMLLAGGIPIPQALEIASRSAASPMIRAQLSAAREAVLTGSNLETALDEHVRFESVLGDMVRIGESTGTLDEMFAYIASNGEEHAGDRLEIISNVFAPLLLLLVGITIAALVMAMYMPMFGVADLISGT